MMPNNNGSVAVIGAGLAGCEAALVLARSGIPVTIYEARPQYMPPAHTTDLPAELVCSNSLKSKILPSAHGLLKVELHYLESPLLAAANATAVAAGSALAVDRTRFSMRVMDMLHAEERITLLRKEVEFPPKEHILCIIAAGPLASEKLCGWLSEALSESALNFYDAIAPIISQESIDRTIVFSASRWEEGDGDYINCPFSKEEYRIFYEALRDADRVNAYDFEDSRFFESCLPIEIAAERGFMALAFGPLRPVGLVDPRTGKRPYAVCQLRREQISGDSYNMVGFQTRLKIPEQQRVFRRIPGLENAEFLRYGSIHRNTYLNSPALLNTDLSFKKLPNMFCAGQLCGNEGYTESIATGHIAALSVVSRLRSSRFILPPFETALGSLIRHVTLSKEKVFSPSGINFGLFPPLENGGKIVKKEKQKMLCDRALEKLREWRR